LQLIAIDRSSDQAWETAVWPSGTVESANRSNREQAIDAVLGGRAGGMRAARDDEGRDRANGATRANDDFE